MNDPAGPRWPIVRLAGEIDLANAPAIDHTIRSTEQARAGAVVLDMADVTFIDSSGVHMLIRLLHDGIHVRIVHASPAITRVLTLTGVHEIVGIELG